MRPRGLGKGSGTGAENTTLYLGPLEIRDFGSGASKRRVGNPAHHSPRRMSRLAEPGVHRHDRRRGGVGKRSSSRPFGEITDFNAASADPSETKGFIGEGGRKQNAVRNDCALYACSAARVSSG